MYLRDMHLHIPYPDNEREDFINKYMREYNCTHEQAIIIDSDINWKGMSKRFFLETNCIVLMFLRLLGKYKNEDIKKIVVYCVGTLTGNKNGTALGIHVIEQKVDYNGFFLKTDYEKKQFTLDIIKRTISEVAQDKRWDISYYLF